MISDEFDFIGFFRQLQTKGFPDIDENHEFRKAMINALIELDNSISANKEENEKNEFIFSQELLEEKRKLITSSCGSATMNAAANWLIQAYQEGFINSK